MARRLTEMSLLAGCGAKLGAADLGGLIEELKDVWFRSGRPRPLDLVLGLEDADDAAVYRIAPNRAIVSTVDFFAPIVDDPYAYGAISAANALSDVYAMGGEPLFALNILCLPIDLDPDIARMVMRGGAEKLLQAGAMIVGGHTVIDAEPKYGLAVTGMVDPAHMLTKRGATAGQTLFLTKPLGTGLVCTAAKFEEANLGDVTAAVDSMVTLNAKAAAIVRTLRASAATDITGFGLLGHANELATASNVRIRLLAAALPLLPGALGYAYRGIISSGGERNRLHMRGHVEIGKAVSPELEHVLYDPQTSGGLLFAIDSDRSDEARVAFEANELSLWRIGDVLGGTGILVE